MAVIGPAASAAPTDAGRGSAYVTPPSSVTPLQGIEQAAGPGHVGQVRPGPAHRHVPAGHPGLRAHPGLPGDRPAGYTGTLTAPQTGTYVLAMNRADNTTVALDGQEILAPGPRGDDVLGRGGVAAGQTVHREVSGGGGRPG